MAEWLKAAVLKTVISSDRDRGFESLSLLHIITSITKGTNYDYAFTDFVIRIVSLCI